MRIRNKTSSKEDNWSRVITIKQSVSKNKANKKKNVEEENRLKIHIMIIAYSMVSQMNLWSFMHIEFGFKQDSYLWGIQTMGKS